MQIRSKKIAAKKKLMKFFYKTMYEIKKRFGYFFAYNSLQCLTGQTEVEK